MNIILVSKPTKNDNEYKIYNDNYKNNIFIGITSYLEFPAQRYQIHMKILKKITKNINIQKYVKVGFMDLENPEKIFHT